MDRKGRQEPADQVVTPGALMRWIVGSLYMDEAIPTGRLIQWYYRLVTGVELTHGQIASLIESTPGMYLDPPAQKKLDFLAVLEEPPPCFQGFVQESLSMEEVASAAAWAEARAFCRRAAGHWQTAIANCIQRHQLLQGCRTDHRYCLVSALAVCSTWCTLAGNKARSWAPVAIFSCPTLSRRKTSIWPMQKQGSRQA
ncbi:unnamed protein product [Polarella glacialis]|uniref:Uncharacterized protein n=1 Tax=Polarella glacialis TaxID=89957 RepID=A0A813LZN8_POLGL|nr:unnamed protein product [Polarella glacialis]